MKNTIRLLLLVLLFAFNACNIINPAEKIPTYIKIDSVKLMSTVPTKHGSVSHKITDVWAYYNFQLLGAFELPAKIPVLADGKGQLQLIAGIWDNGLSGTRAKYPFMYVDTFTFNASPTQEIYYTPAFKYRTSDTPLVKYFVEDFEQGNIFVSNYGDTTFLKTNETLDVYEGDWSACMNMTTDKPNGSSITSLEYMLPPNNDAYMELNYKSDAPFDIRTQIYQAGTTVTSDIISFKARENWTKVYVRLTGFAASFQYGKFKFIFNSSLPSGMSNAKLSIDNFKIIYFN